MIKISDNQLNIKLEQSDDLRYFITVGTDPYLQHTAQVSIKNRLRQLGFEEQSTFSIDNQTNWDAIYLSSQSVSLFSSKTLLILSFGETALTTTITKKLEELTHQISPDVSVLISLAKITKAQENAKWIKPLSDHLIMVSCNTPDVQQLPKWITLQLKQLELIIEPQGIELLCYYYEGNLLALMQILEQLKLLYPSGKIGYDELKVHLNDSTVFTPYHWIDAMLMGKIKRSIHILQQLKMNGTEPLILLRTIQRELIQLINIKKHSTTNSLKAAYDVYRVWQSRRNLLTPYLQNKTIEQLYQTLQKLTEIEVILKHDYQTPIWEQLDTLTILFIGSKI